MTYKIIDETPRFHLQRYKFPEQPAKGWVMNTDCLYIQYKTKPTLKRFKDDLGHDFEAYSAIYAIKKEFEVKE